MLELNNVPGITYRYVIMLSIYYIYMLSAVIPQMRCNHCGPSPMPMPMLMLMPRPMLH